MNYVFYCLVGAAAGAFSGMFGLGGAVIIIPVLVYIFGFQQQTAQGTSLAMLLPPIGLLAAWRYYNAGHVNVGAAISHAIIVSRELGLPCVVSATDATVRIPDGALIRVDGDTGAVTVMEVPT